MLRAKANRLLLAALLTVGVFGPLLLLRSATTVRAVSSTLVISQVYTQGGTGGASYRNDFVELFNVSNVPISLTGLSLQYAPAGSTFNGTGSAVVTLSGIIPAGGYYLVQFGGGNSNSPPLLPTPVNATGAANLADSGGKLAIVNGTTALTCGTPAARGPAACAAFVSQGGRLALKRPASCAGPGFPRPAFGVLRNASVILSGYPGATPHLYLSAQPWQFASRGPLCCAPAGSAS